MFNLSVFLMESNAMMRHTSHHGEKLRLESLGTMLSQTTLMVPSESPRDSHAAVVSHLPETVGNPRVSFVEMIVGPFT